MAIKISSSPSDYAQGIYFINEKKIDTNDPKWKSSLDDDEVMFLENYIKAMNKISVDQTQKVVTGSINQ